MLTSELINYGGIRGKAYILFLFVIVSAIFFTSSFAHSGISSSYSSQILTGKDPIRLAISQNGHIFASVPMEKKVYVIDKNNGSLIRTIDAVAHPLSIAVDDANNNLYIGDFKNGSVRVVKNDSNTTHQFWLGGRASGEFGLPGDIVIAGGRAFVTDSPNHIVKVYSTANGSFLFSFGGYGTAAGKMIYPTGIAFDERNQEIYVSDHENGRVLVFTLNANGTGVIYKRAIGAFGTGPGRLARPQGIHVQNNKVYIADAYHSNIAVFARTVTTKVSSTGVVTTTISEVFTGFIGKFGTNAGRLKVPMDVLMSGTKMYIANSDNRRIEVFDVLDAHVLEFSPNTLDFTSGIQVNPEPQVLAVASQVPGGTAAWTATTSAPFIRLSASSGTTPSNVTVSIDVTGMAAGNYSGEIRFLSQNNIVYPVTVNLTLTPKTLLAMPSSLSISHTEGGSLGSMSLSIGDIGGILNWTATTNNHWLSLSKTSGTTPDSLIVQLTPTVNNFKTGTYNGAITITSPNAIGSPLVVPVTLTMTSTRQQSHQTITVYTNHANASFTITGPATYSGGGTSWSSNVEVGAYIIAFAHIAGYRKPATMQFEVEEGEEVIISVQYIPVPVANIIATAKGAGRYPTGSPITYNDSTVRIFNKAGDLLSEFLTLTTLNGASIAMGDVNGDGESELIAAPSASAALANSRALVRLFSNTGQFLGTTGEIKIDGILTRNGANIAADDIDRDGRDEIIVSVLDTNGFAFVIVYSVDSSYRFTEMARLALGKGSTLPPYIALGYPSDDGKIRLAIAYRATIITPTGTTSTENRLETYSFNGDMRLVFEKKIKTAGVRPVVLVDLNGDGVDEIISAYNIGTVGSTTSPRRTELALYKGDLTLYASTPLRVNTGDLAAVPNLSFIDYDGDNKREILIGQGSNVGNDAIYRVVSPNGTIIETDNAFTGIKFGTYAVSGKRLL